MVPFLFQQRRGSKKYCTSGDESRKDINHNDPNILIFSHSLSLSLFLEILFLSFSPFISLSLFPCLYLSLFLSLSLFHINSNPKNISHFILSLPLNIYLTLYLYISLALYLSISLSLSFSFSLPVFLSLSPFPSLFLSLSHKQ